MSNTAGKFQDGTEIKGNLSIISDICNGDGSVELAGTLYTNNILEYSTNSLGISIEGSLFYNNNAIITSTIPWTNSSTASLIVNGGIGVLKDSNINGILTIYNTTDSINTTTGALIVSGGLLVKQNTNLNTLILKNLNIDVYLYLLHLK